MMDHQLDLFGEPVNIPHFGRIPEALPPCSPPPPPPPDLTPEGCAARWWGAGDPDYREHWDRLPRYERDSWIATWKFERYKAGEKPIPSAEYVAALQVHHLASARTMATGWAMEILAAFEGGRPCPIKPEPRYKWVLRWAIDMARIPPASLGLTETDTDDDR